jgi:hypothetical protein
VTRAFELRSGCRVLTGLVALISGLIACDHRDEGLDTPLDETGLREWSLARTRDTSAIVPTNGPLRVSERNSRYFVDKDGTPILLVGSHTWNNLQDIGFGASIAVFDYDGFLNFLGDHGHNFFRLWTWENARGHLGLRNVDVRNEPLPYRRTGPGLALDGLPKFDLTQFDSAYFDRLRSRVELARDRGIYVSVMLFNGFAVASRKNKPPLANPWLSHPFNSKNNINGIDGDPDDNQSGEETHELRNESVLAVQERYVHKVIDTVGDLDNVLYEVSNESHAESERWQYHIIDAVKRYESDRRLQHPVGMTVEFPGGDNAEIFRSPADWVSPNGDLAEPAIATGEKVVIADTDHLCGHCGNAAWAWKSFLQGQNPIFMDVFSASTAEALDEDIDVDNAEWLALRRNLGFIRELASQLKLEDLSPRPDLASSGYCLASLVPGDEELVIYSAGEPVDIDFSNIRRDVTVFFVRLADGGVIPMGRLAGGREIRLPAPLRGEFVLLVR